MIKFIKKIIPEKYHNSWLVDSLNKLFRDVYKNISYSQEGEDLILQRIFERQKSGFYVDVGAHHPKRFSNTCIFYKKGWRGINIDAMPGSMKAFNKKRPYDINIEAAISNESKTLKFYSFNDAALNTFNENLAKERQKIATLTKTYSIKTVKLSDILDRYLPKGTQIDFLTVDVEGLDYEVLLSNDWEKFQPRYILVEITGAEFWGLSEHPISKMLNAHSYSINSKTYNTILFKHLVI